MSEDAILDYIDSKPFTKNLIQSKWQNNSMVLVLLLNGVMVMVTRFSTVILCLAAGISVLFLVLYWRFCRGSTELRGALFYGGSVIAYLAVLFAVILACLVREHFAEVSPFVVYLVSIAIVALCFGISWISIGRKLRGNAAPKESRTGRAVSYIAIAAISYIVARLIFSGISDDAAWLVGTLALLVAAIVLSFYTYPLYLAFLLRRGDS